MLRLNENLNFLILTFFEIFNHVLSNVNINLWLLQFDVLRELSENLLSGILQLGIV